MSKPPPAASGSPPGGGISGLRAALHAACFGGILLLGLPAAHSQESLVDVESFRAGCQSLADGRFETAAKQLRETWEQLLAIDAGEIEKDFVASRLLEALVRNEDTRSAVDWIDRHPSASSSAETNRWKALALQAEGRYAEAAEAYALLQSAIPDPGRSVRLDHALCLAHSGRAERALEVLDEDPVAEAPGEVLKIAYIQAEAGQIDSALRLLEKSRDSLPAPDPEAALARLRLEITLLLQGGREEEAVARVLDHIDASGDDRSALLGFLLLEQTGVAPTYPPLRSRMADWAANQEHPASKTARFFSPILLEPDQDQTDFLEETIESDPGSLLAAEAALRLVEEEGTSEEFTPGDDARNHPGGEIRSSHVLAARSFREQKFADAAREFSRLASLQSGSNRMRALHNEALSLLEEGDFEGFSERVETLRRTHRRSPLVGDLDYLGGLDLVSRSDSRGFALLEGFIRENSEHRHTIDARIALAEAHLNQVPARTQAAREIFEELRVRPLSLEQNERLDYSSVWLESLEGNDSAFSEAARSFLSDWPNSVHGPEIRMLLARALFSGGELAAAKELFLEIAEQHPDSPFSEIARFFAIKATEDAEEAIAGWRKLIGRDGPYTNEARHELGLLFLSLHRHAEARREFEAVFESAAEDDPLRFASLGDIGCSLYLEAIEAGGDSELLEEASEAFARLARMPDAPPEWVYNASVRRGKCLEALGRPNVALELYESILTRREETGPIPGSPSNPEALTWVFRAGFAAIDILSEQENWEAAIRTADILSKEDGPRAIKASRLSERLRLQHWVWD